MKNEKIIQAFDSNNPSNEVKERIANHVLRNTREFPVEEKEEEKISISSSLTEESSWKGKIRKAVAVAASICVICSAATIAYVTYEKLTNEESGTSLSKDPEVETSQEQANKNQTEEDQSENSKGEKENVDSEPDLLDLKFNDTTYYDTTHHIKITLPCYNNRYQNVVMNGFYVNVEGEGIESITYAINQGSFVQLLESDKAGPSKKCILMSGEEHTNSSCEYIGSQDKLYWERGESNQKYTVEYNKQNGIEYAHAIEFYNSGETKEEQPRELSQQTTINDIDNTSITMEILLEDGTKIEKQINIKANGITLKREIVQVYLQYTIE